MRLLPLLAVVLLAGCAGQSGPSSGTTTPATATLPAASSDFVQVETSKGTFVMHLDASLAPKTVAHLKDLVARGFYDGIPFHRYVANFVIQGGDPNCKGDGWKSPGASGCGTGGSGQAVPGEFSGKHDYGAVGLARSTSPDSGDSQFYVVINPAGAHNLDGSYCVLGSVTRGMEVVTALRAGDLMTKVSLVES